MIAPASASAARSDDGEEDEEEEVGGGGAGGGEECGEVEDGRAPVEMRGLEAAGREEGTVLGSGSEVPGGTSEVGCSSPDPGTEP